MTKAMQALPVEIQQAIKKNHHRHKTQWQALSKGLIIMSEKNIHPEDQAVSDAIWLNHISYMDKSFDERKASDSLKSEQARAEESRGAQKKLAIQREKKRKQADERQKTKLAHTLAVIVCIAIALLFSGVLTIIYKAIGG